MIVGRTESLCPVCLRRLPAELLQDGQTIRLRRVCPEHGETTTDVWHGPPDYVAWTSVMDATSVPGGACPTACGLCADHQQETCCVLVEVTAACDLGCPVCFAQSGPAGSADPSRDEVARSFEFLLSVAPGCNVQLSGGEPTLRDDLPDLVAAGRRAGLGFFQLNTNGLRLARDPDYVAALAGAGLDVVFLQFDGVTRRPHELLRGRALLDEKLAAIEACGAAGLGVVLVPTVAEGVNLHELGALLDLALERAPAVRGMHVQPLALFGRYPGEGAASGSRRTTLPDVVRALAEQSRGRVRLDDLLPGDCEHALCSFSREYVRAADGGLMPLEQPVVASCCGGGGKAATLSASEKAAHVARRWSLPPVLPTAAGATSCCGTAADDAFDAALDDLRRRAFTLSGMAFQDVWSVDLARLRRCYVHVLTRDHRLVPFCAYNLTGSDGRSLPGGRGSAVTAGVPASGAPVSAKPASAARVSAAPSCCAAKGGGA